jgi:hypothetical protein
MSRIGSYQGTRRPLTARNLAGVDGEIAVVGRVDEHREVGLALELTATGLMSVTYRHRPAAQLGESFQ